MQKPKQNSRMQTVYNELKESIIYGTLTPGTILNEGELAEHYGVSKTPVREALNRLGHEGLVEVISFKGYIVSQISLRDLLEIFQLRSFLECSGAELAAQCITDDQLGELKKLTVYELNHGEIDHIHFMKLNKDFHVKVAEATRNERLARLVENLLEQLQRVLFLDLKSSNVEEMMNEHRELVYALEQRNPEKARNSMYLQIEQSKRRITQFYKVFA